jgi:hypothetical protein
MLWMSVQEDLHQTITKLLFLCLIETAEINAVQQPLIHNQTHDFFLRRSFHIGSTQQRPQAGLMLNPSC